MRDPQRVFNSKINVLCEKCEVREGLARVNVFSRGAGASTHIPPIGLSKVIHIMCGAPSQTPRLPYAKHCSLSAFPLFETLSVRVFQTSQR